MKKTLNSTFRILTQSILFFILVFNFSCHEDELNQLKMQNNESNNIKLTGYIFPSDSVIKSKAILNKHITTKFKQTNTVSRTLNSTNLGFSIDTSEVLIIKSDIFDSYTFKVERENQNINSLENYVLTYYNDNTYTQFLIEYPIIEDANNNNTYDMANAIYTSINDNALLTTSRAECSSWAQEWQEGECFAVNCGGSSGSGNHGPEDTCNADASDQPYYWCTAGSWVNTFCTQYIDENGGGGGGSINTGGANQGNQSNDDDDDGDTATFPAVPFGDLGALKECKKINDFLNHEDNTLFKNKLLEYANPDNANDNINIDFEKGIFKFDGLLQPQFVEGDASQDNAAIVININSNADVTAFHHIHYNNPNTPGHDTVSIFTIDDLLSKAILFKENLAATNIIFFLTTAKGTNYAITVDDSSKLLDFFEPKLEPEPEIVNNNFQDFLAWQKKSIEFNKINKKYFDPKKGLIKPSNSSNLTDLKHFLEFINDVDLGVSLFKTNATFNEFTNVKYNKNSINNIRETPCNN